jgi:hypothetical protein
VAEDFGPIIAEREKGQHVQLRRPVGLELDEPVQTKHAGELQATPSPICDGFWLARIALEIWGLALFLKLGHFADAYWRGLS